MFTFYAIGLLLNLNFSTWAARVSPAVCNRLVDAARAILNKFLTDIYIYTDHNKGPQSGKYGGCVDSTNQSLAAVLMALGDKDVSKVQTGPLSPYIVRKMNKSQIKQSTIGSRIQMIKERSND
ncbi:hypothetical protein LSH36_28g09080 [Paralvinella palmiformis]|uniref:RNA 3'-terminal phosphate cyclase insert domain-containing protein n=1 Tax=Paralvinella palmiformis TaxID=53620 RepID=A0AAD9KBJ3_9ANNE|nr:hypothetical protein LSH36_28g09080 [Paralvinella palmiformis]